MPSRLAPLAGDEPAGRDATAGVVEEVAALQARYAARNRSVRRAFHVKTIAGATGHLVVADDVPAPLRAGLFARPMRYDAVVRFSSGQSWEQPDWMPDVRGLALRVLGPGSSAGNERWEQDFLAQNGNVRFARDVAEFARLMPLMESMATVPLHIGRSVGFRRALALGRDFGGIAGRALTCLSGQSFFCVAPIAVGPTPAKVAFLPRQRPRRRSRLFARDGLRDSIDARLAEADLAWDVTLQPFRDDKTTPLDDLGVRWDERASPPVRVASLVLSRRDRQSAERLRTEVEEKAFSPWNALPEHRPLGSIQELRRHAYAASAALRRSSDENGPPDGSAT